MIKFRPGDRVQYSDGFHTCETGTVSSVQTYVFVRFDDAVGKWGWEGATSKACMAENLTIIEGKQNDD